MKSKSRTKQVYNNNMNKINMTCEIKERVRSGGVRDQRACELERCARSLGVRDQGDQGACEIEGVRDQGACEIERACGIEGRVRSKSV